MEKCKGTKLEVPPAPTPRMIPALEFCSLVSYLTHPSPTQTVPDSHSCHNGSISTFQLFLRKVPDCKNSASWSEITVGRGWSLSPPLEFPLPCQGGSSTWYVAASHGRATLECTKPGTDSSRSNMQREPKFCAASMGSSRDNITPWG